MGDVWDDLLKPTSIQELIDAGYLSPFRVFAESAPDLSEVRVRAGDYRGEDLSEIAGSVALTANVISTWLDKGENRQTICYAVDRKHSRDLTARFLAAGVAAEHVDCDTPRAEREAIFARYTDGTTRILCNVDVLGIGLDVDCRCVVIARPTCYGKIYLLVLDFAGNHTRLGLVTEIDFPELLKSDRSMTTRSGSRANHRQRFAVRP